METRLTTLGARRSFERREGKHGRERPELRRSGAREHLLFYRPKVEEHEPEGAEDLQNFYVVLSPHGKKMHRLLVVGRERLPDPEHKGKQRHWAFVDAIYEDAKPLSEALRERKYSTKTRGERHLPAARSAGEGMYEIVRHEGHTHLAYVLELPAEAGAVQHELRIVPEASYVISVKNPDKPSPPGVGLSGREVSLPKTLRERFRDRRFIDVDPPEFLDHEGVELILVAASAKAGKELEKKADTGSSPSADVFRDLRLHRTKHPLEPLFEGRWE